MNKGFVLSAYTWLIICVFFFPSLVMFAGAFDSNGLFQHVDPNRFLTCLGNSIEIAFLVVPFSILFGLSGAVVLIKCQPRFSGALWGIVLSPILIPGIVIGVSALLLWGRFNLSAGYFSIVFAQTTFISSYCLLIISSRLQKMPIDFERSAISLGASPNQTFFRITLPYLWPSILSSLVIAFLASVENYNTTMFAKGGFCTLATEIGSMTRHPNGAPPVVNFLGFFIIVATFICAAIYTFNKKGAANG